MLISFNVYRRTVLKIYQNKKSFWWIQIALYYPTYQVNQLRQFFDIFEIQLTNYLFMGFIKDKIPIERLDLNKFLELRLD